MNVRLAKLYAALMHYVPTLWAASCVHASQNTQEMPERRVDVETSMSVKYLNILAALMQFVKTRCQVTIVFAHKDTELNLILKSLVNR